MPDRNEADKQLKVTDKRMFTPEGELRDEYKNLSAESSDSSATSTSRTTIGTGGETIVSGAVPSRAPQPPTRPPTTAQNDAGKVAAKKTPPETYSSGAQFEDLVAMLAQTTVTFLQQASQPQARTESLEQAQLYLDLLGILEEKTTGNLAPRENAMLQDAVRQLRLAFAQRA